MTAWDTILTASTLAMVVTCTAAYRRARRRMPWREIERFHAALDELDRRALRLERRIQAVNAHDYDSTGDTTTPGAVAANEAVQLRQRLGSLRGGHDDPRG